MLSPSGQCKTFDASANGFVPGEGVGAVVLKRLADAEADHDNICGVIIGSGINQDGATNGMTAPSAKSQIDLVHEIYQKYAIDTESINYVETHGTGTKLGDPIELQALATVFQERTQRKQYCAIGSVKTNIGHTLAAAGMASVQKVLLAMKQKKLVPSLHFQQPNPHFDFAASPFYVNTAVQDWQTGEGIPRRAAVSSFGFSGTNAHVVIEEYIPRPHPQSVETPILFVLSARSEQQLKTYAQDMKHWIQAHEELALTDITFTLQLGREAMEYRLAILADSRAVLLQRLASFVDNQTSTGIYTAQVKKSSLWLETNPTSSPGSDVALFEADEDGQSLLHIWFQKEKLEKIAQAWVKGVNIDWMLLYQGVVGTGAVGVVPCADPVPCANPVPTAPVLLPTSMPYRVSLPTYPFARKRHWLSAPTIEIRRDSGRTGLAPVRSQTTGSSQPTEVSPQPSGGAAAVTSPTPILSVRLSSVEQDKPAVQGTQATADTANENGQTPRVGIALRPVGIVQTCGLAPQLEEELTRSLAEALYMEESDIDVEKPFAEIGLDSVIGVEWIQSLNKQYACHLKASCVYDHPTIRQLAGFIEAELSKNGGGMQQASVQSTPSLSLDDMLRQVQQRNLEPEKAEQLLHQLFL
jgi:acyl transferase domain-containing protein